MAARFDLHPDFARRIESGKYWLFDMECPTEVMAAYERLWATHGRSGRAQQDGDLLIAWVVQNTLVKGDFELASKLRIALETLGWRPTD
jgi:hypothetical protein